jgi:phospholipase B1
MRTNLHNTIVNILGVSKGKLSCCDPCSISRIYGPLTVSDIYYLTKGLRPLHHNIGCRCAMLDGDIGQSTRDLMDDLMNQYSVYSRSSRFVSMLLLVADDRLVRIITEYQTKNYPDFAVLWFPANVPLSSYPITGESPVVSLIRLIKLLFSPQRYRLFPSVRGDPRTFCGQPLE